jgi:hypothetical protein
MLSDETSPLADADSDGDTPEGMNDSRHCYSSRRQQAWASTTGRYNFRGTCEARSNHVFKVIYASLSIRHHHHHHHHHYYYKLSPEEEIDG